MRGEGVVGEQPILKPGEKYEYTSGAPLNTPSGFMNGYYEMSKKKFDKIIDKWANKKLFKKVKNRWQPKFIVK